MKTRMKLNCFLVFLKIVSSVYSTDVEGDPDLESYLREAIENFREQMKEGIEAINMPVLDPLELKNLDINVYENLATMTLKISEMTVQDLSTFQFHDIVPDLENLFLKVNLTIPQVSAWGKYDLQGRLLKIFPLNGNGDFQTNITSARIAGIGQLDLGNDTLQMMELDLDLSWEKVTIYLENFLGGGKFSDVLQRMLPNIGKSIFDKFKPNILKMMNSALKDSVNKSLEKPEVKKIIEGILPKKG